MARHLRSRGVEVAVSVAEAIRSEGGFGSGLASLTVAFAEYGGRGFGVYVCATPGFKPEAAFLAVSAMLLGVNAVYYVSEAFERAVELPGVAASIRGSIPRSLGTSSIAVAWSCTTPMECWG